MHGRPLKDFNLSKCLAKLKQKQVRLLSESVFHSYCFLSCFNTKKFIKRPKNVICLKKSFTFF